MQEQDMATPLGKLVPVNEISGREVSIKHRPKREIFNGSNAGEKFKAKNSQERVKYDDVLDWPLVNPFPERLHSDPAVGDRSREEFHDHCPSYTVLPDFWKYWALRLKIDLGDRWRLDFTADGTLAMNHTPHGAAATARDGSGIRRFVVWNGFQLHGDVGERLGLTRKMARKDWLVMRNTAYPNALDKDLRGKKISYECLGEPCPETYRFPPDWDVLGDLPPKDWEPPKPSSKRPSNMRLTNGETTTKKPRLEDPLQSSMKYGKAAAIPSNTSSTLQFPKAWGRPTPTSGPTDSKLAALVAENAHLKNKLAFADSKIKTLTIFGSRHDNSLWLLSDRIEKAARSGLAITVEEFQPLLDGIDQTISGLNKSFPTLAELITAHEDPEEIRETSRMAEWVSLGDHLQMEEDSGLRGL